MSTDVKVPALGESITEATLGQWLKQPGDAVAQDEPIAALETDKVSLEVNSPVTGTLAEQLVKEGDTLAVGALIARIGEGGAVAQPAAPASPAKPPAEEVVAGAPVNPSGAGENPRPREDSDPAPAHDAALTLSPAVRRAVLELHVDPSTIKGTAASPRTMCWRRRREKLRVPLRRQGPRPKRELRRLRRLPLLPNPPASAARNASR
jgi:2-oxoglutarate dehydrogenase E2 component (dihydrolipoamide succinyltransferase)